MATWYRGMGKYLDEEKDAPAPRYFIAAKVEHPFHVIKNLFGYRKVHHKGLAKNQA